MHDEYLEYARLGRFHAHTHTQTYIRTSKHAYTHDDMSVSFVGVEHAQARCSTDLHTHRETAAYGPISPLMATRKWRRSKHTY